MKKTIANATALALVTATFLGQTPNVWISQTKDVPILDIFSPEIAQAAQGNVSVYLNGEKVNFPNAQPNRYSIIYYSSIPQITPDVTGTGSLLIPIRELVEPLGYTIEWDASTKATTVRKGDFAVVFNPYGKYGDRVVPYRNGVRQDTGPNSSSYSQDCYIIDNTLMVKPEVFVKLTGATYEWDGNTNTFHFTLKIPSLSEAQIPGRPDVEDIYFDGYVINKVKFSNGVVLCKGDTKEIVESLLGEPDRDTCNNPYKKDDKYILEERNFWYDNMNLTLVYTNEGRLSSVFLRGSGDSFMGYTMGDPFSLDQELRPYERWNSGLGYVWPDLRGAYKEEVSTSYGAILDKTQIEYSIYGNTQYTNEPKPTYIDGISVDFYYYYI